MKTGLKILLGVLGLIVALILIIGLTGAKNYDVNRTVEINAPAEVIWPYVSNIKRHAEWSPWVKRDPDMKNEFEGTMGEVGSLNRWEGPVSGKGEQEITELVPNKRVETELRFKEPFESQSDAYILLDEKGETTEVTWGFKGENGFIERVMFTLMSVNLDAQVGGDYEEGLNMLKKIAEDNYAQIVAAREAAEAAAEAEADDEDGASEE